MNHIGHNQKVKDADFLGSNTKIFFPFNEGSGDDIADLGEFALSFNKAGNVYTVPHAIKQLWLNNTRSDSTVIPNLLDADKHLLMLLIGIPRTNTFFFNFSLGIAGSGFFMEVNGFQATINSALGGAGITSAFTGVTLGQTALLAVTLNKDTGDMVSYQGINGGAVSANAVKDASPHLKQKGEGDSNSCIIGNSNAHDFETAGFLQLNTLPTSAELLTYLDHTYSECVQGHKILDPRFKNF